MKAETETIESQDYLNFLQELFQVIFDSEGDREILGAFFVNHLDKLNESLGEILYQWAKNTLLSLESEQADSLATAIAMFGSLIDDAVFVFFPLSYFNLIYSPNLNLSRPFIKIDFHNRSIK